MHHALQSTKSLTILQMVTSLLDYYLCMGMDPFDRELAANTARRSCLLYSALHEQAKADGNDLLWKVKPKFHMWSELAEHSSWGNPAFHWTYADEDFVGWIASLAGSKGGPKVATTAAAKVLNRYVAA